MARQPRYVLPGQVQHVIQRGNNQASVFLRAEDYDFYLKCLSEACVAHGCDVHAYVLMPNHVHLLLTPRRGDGVSKVMQSVGGRYAQYANSAYRRNGTVWGGRYRSTVIDADDYLLPCMRYIELNPVRKGIVLDPSRYLWSSYRSNAEASAAGPGAALTKAHAVYLLLGKGDVARREKYRSLFDMPLDATMLDAIRDATNKGWALGGEQFRERLESVLRRRVQPLPRGGDRRSARARQERIQSTASDPVDNPADTFTAETDG